jgi:hypothetical protein
MSTLTMQSSNMGLVGFSWGSSISNPSQHTYLQSIKNQAAYLHGGPHDLSVLLVTASIGKLNALEVLGTNWDGFESDKPNAHAIANATMLLPVFFHAAFEARYTWVQPHVGANEVGDITFEWWNKNRKLTLYISSNEVDYIKVWGADIDTEMEDGKLDSDIEFAALWQWLCAA